MNRFGYPETQWTKAKTEAKQVLIERARVGGVIAYSDLVPYIYAIAIEAHDPRLFNLLGQISVEEDEAGRGMLSVIVVHKVGDQQPGPGFFELAKQLNRDISDTNACWIQELNKVYDYWSTR